MDRFRQEVTALLPQLRVFARSLARDPHLADDLVQDTVVRALQAERQFAKGTNLRAWLFTILRNRFRGVMRRRRLEPENGVDAEQAEAWSCPAPQGALLEVRAFRRAFGQLAWAHREVLVLVGVHGLTYDQVAEVCGCEIGTVKSRLHRARDQLKQLLLGDAPDKDARRPNPAVSAGRSHRATAQQARAG